MNTLILSSVHRETRTKPVYDKFEDSIKKEAVIKNENELLYVIRRIKKLKDMKSITDISLFKEGIQPMWEDPKNITGGKWVIRINKDTIEQRLFERLLAWMALVPFKTMDVNGIVVSIRAHYTVLSIWTATVPTDNIKDQENEIREVLEIKPIIKVHFKGNDESLKDNSSFKKVPKYKSPQK
ncbi:translation initiation factor 4E [Nematocida sp. AWRm80]|nr:translation initiation factor 4E [Nematocida sp. AWRm80]